MQQQIGGRVGAQHVAQSTEVRGVLLVEEDRLQIQPVKQDETVQAVGPFDCACVSPEPFSDPLDQLADLR